VALILLESLLELADIRSREGNLDGAVDLLQTGIDLLEEGREKHPILWCKLVDRLAWVHFRQGKLENAFDLANLVLQDVKTLESNDPITLASLNNTLGGIYWMRSQLQDAILHVERSLEINKNLNFYWGMAIAYTNLGVLQYTLGEWHAAVSNMVQADTLRSEHGYVSERPNNLKNLGEILISIGDHTQAREKLETSREISNQLGLNLFEAYAELGLCRLSLIEEKIAEAITHLAIAKNLVKTTEDKPDDRTIQILFLEAQIDALLGKFESALELAQKANQIAHKGGFQEETTETQRILGMIYAQSGEYALAEQWIERSIESAQDQNDLYRKAQALFELGQNCTAWRNFNPSIHALLQSKGQNAYDQAIDSFKKLGARYHLHRAQKARNKFSSLPATGSLNPDVVDAKLTSKANHSRAQRYIEEGALYQAVILALHLVPQQGANPEDVFESIALVLPYFLDFADRINGQVLRRQDGIIIIFGVPMIHEDDPIKAVDTAIHMIDFYQEFHDQSPIPWIIQVGITIGSVTVGWIGGETEGDYIFTGDAVRDADMIAKLASPVSVWVTDNVRDETLSLFDYSAVPQDLISKLPGLKIYQLEGRGHQMLDS
jgi:tetratricopeptide (TPR) repeat protein